MLPAIIVNANKDACVYGLSSLMMVPNVSLCGADMKLIAATHRTISNLGIDHRLVNDKTVGTFIGVVQSHLGHVLVCMNEGAGVPTQKTSVLSKVQMTDYGCKVDDTSILHDGKQVFISKCGHFFPLELHNGLCCLDIITYPTEEDERTLDTVIWILPSAMILLMYVIVSRI